MDEIEIKTEKTNEAKKIKKSRKTKGPKNPKNRMNKTICYSLNGDIVTDQILIESFNFEYAQVELVGDHAKNTDKGNTMLISACDYDYAIYYKWYLNKSGYPSTYGSNDGSIQFGVLVPFHQLIFGQQLPGMVIDHINRDRLDNRRSNLRLCTSLENSYNRSKPSGSKNKYKGVTKRGIKKPTYTASITKDGVKHEIKGCLTEEDAAKMYDVMAEELFGEFAAKNFPNST